MSYDLRVADSAWDVLVGLVSEVPIERRDALLQEVERQLLAFCESPRRQGRTIFGRPTCILDLEVDDVRYYWAAVYQHTEDEQAVYITDFFRRSLF